MSKFFDTLFAMIASSVILIIRSNQQPKSNLTFFEIYIFPILMALMTYLILHGISKFIKYINRPLKKYEGYWIEIIEKPAAVNHDEYISILELTYENNSYSIRGSTFLQKGDNVATWRADRTHLFDKQKKLLDYIYTSDIKDNSFRETTVRGYATIDFKAKGGYIIDIMSENNQKQNFKLTKKIENASDLDEIKASKKLKEELKKFFNE